MGRGPAGQARPDVASRTIPARRFLSAAAAALMIAVITPACGAKSGSDGSHAGATSNSGPVVRSPNLLVNSGAEVGDPSLTGYGSVTIPGWAVTGTPTVIRYGTPREMHVWYSKSRYPTLPALLGFPANSAGSDAGGAQFFGGGPVGSSTLTQTVNLSKIAPQIATTATSYTLSGDLGGFGIDRSRASITVTFLGAAGQTLGIASIGPVGVLDRGLQTRMLHRETTGNIPVGTATAKVVVTLQDLNPLLEHYNNAYADNVSFTLTEVGLPAPPPPVRPASAVGPLDHVFLVDMENHGYGNVVGNPSMAYLNSLINTYGVADHYYALTHPSAPNYFPILGGSDFGYDYDNPTPGIDEPNLADDIEAVRRTWAGYIGPDGFLPFESYSNIADNPERKAAHLFPLTKMATDLATPGTTPNFVWFAAGEDANGEGPIDSVSGKLRYAASFLKAALGLSSGAHYNLAAADDFLQTTVPTIMNSPAWKTQRSALVITWDEDFSNTSLGAGNEGNHVATVVIPSPGAVTAGMRPGHFTATNHYDHYSLLTTIEQALGLPALTNNDKYAQPMNEFWTTPPS